MNHKRHADAKVNCVACHQHAEDWPRATFPLVEDCMGCHREPLGKDPSEPKVRGYAARGEEIPWVQVNRVAGHVYFSHAMHVSVGKLECQVCHGQIALMTASIATPHVDTSMDACMHCHTERGANNECVACHK